MRAKYVLRNLWLNIKSHIAIFCVVSLTLFILHCSFSIRENVLMSQEEGLSKYAVVAITTDGNYYSNPFEKYSIDQDGEQILINNSFMRNFAFDEYVIDYYGFVERHVSPNSIRGLSIGTVESSISVIRYSDISKSVPFVSGNRIMIEGRFAMNEYEANISEELAVLNMLSVGSIFEMTHLGIENKSYTYTVVGIFADYSFDLTKELELSPSILGEDGIPHTSIGNYNLCGNFILLHTADDTFYFVNELGGYNYGYDAAVYYLKNEKDMAAFKDVVSKTLPEQFVMLDSMDMAVYIRHVLDKTVGSFTWLLIIMVVISVVFCTLLYIHVLKSRTYDISVLRARGMPRIKTAYSLTCEMFIVFLLSFAAASVLYFTSFTTISNFMYALQDQFVSNDKSFYYGFSGPIINAAREYEFTATVYPITLIYGFIAVIAFTVIVGFAASLFISRHEPMKTMTKV